MNERIKEIQRVHYGTELHQIKKGIPENPPSSHFSQQRQSYNPELLSCICLLARS